MKKITIMAIFAALIMVSCTNQGTQPDSKFSAQTPVRQNEATGSRLEVIGTWELAAGYLYEYRVEDDTIFVVEGRGSSYPVAVSVK